MMKNYSKIMCIAVVLLCQTQFIKAQTTFTVDEDVFVQGGDNSTTNYNYVDAAADPLVENPELQVKIGTNERFFKRTLVKFDLTAVGLAGSDVSDATLRLYLSAVQRAGTDVTISASETTDGWAEESVVYDDAPASGTFLASVSGFNTDFAPGNSDAAGNLVTKFLDFDVTAYVKAELDGDDIISVVLEDLGAVNSTVEFSTKAGGNPAQLVINNSALSISGFNIEKNTISLYPNPAVDVLNIKVASSEINKLTILDLTGKTLYVNEDAKISSEIDINWLINGIYFLKAETEVGTQLLKFVKK